MSRPIAFGFIEAINATTDIAEYLLNDESGKDPFFEDIGTLWLMHFVNKLTLKK